jgi:hypothetical protein
MTLSNTDRPRGAAATLHAPRPTHPTSPAPASGGSRWYQGWHTYTHYQWHTHNPPRSRALNRSTTLDLLESSAPQDSLPHLTESPVATLTAVARDPSCRDTMLVSTRRRCMGGWGRSGRRKGWDVHGVVSVVHVVCVVGVGCVCRGGRDGTREGRVPRTYVGRGLGDKCKHEQRVGGVTRAAQSLFFRKHSRDINPWEAEGG